MMSNTIFDRLIDEAFDHAESDFTDPYPYDYRVSWNKLKRRLKVERKRQSYKKIVRNASLSVVAMILGVIIFGNALAINAHFPFIQTIREAPSELFTLIFGRKDELDHPEIAKTAPPNDGSLQKGTINSEDAEGKIVLESLDDVENVSGFDMPLFEYIPDGYEVHMVECINFPGEDTTSKIVVTFMDKKERIFWVNLTQLQEDTIISSVGDKSGTQILEINHGSGYFTESSDGANSKIEFLAGNIYVRVVGALNRSELLQFVNGMIW